mgnify:CR=1 FL=1
MAVLRHLDLRPFASIIRKIPAMTFLKSHYLDRKLAQTLPHILRYVTLALTLPK